MLKNIFYKLASVFLALAVSFAALGSAQAAAGALDPTFDGDGKVITPIASSPAGDLGNAILVQPDGKIVVAGLSDQGITLSDFALARYNSDGSLDTAFDADGKVTTDFGGNDIGSAVVLQPDGNLVVVGSNLNAFNDDFALARYNSDGSLDTSFDVDGKVTTDIGGSDDAGAGVVLQPDGKIIVAGSSFNGVDDDFALARYNSDGSLDTTFDADGKVNTDFGGSFDAGAAVVLQPDGKLVVAGTSNSNFALARYNVDGSLDTAFDADGKVTTDFASGLDLGFDMALQPDGELVVAGSSSMGGNEDFALARYNNDGSLDTTFDADGKVTTDFGSSFDRGFAVVLQLDSKIIVAGDNNSDFALARYNSDGSLDTTFDSDGKVTTDFNSNFFDVASAVALQPDGKIVAAGSSIVDGISDFDFAVARYDAADSALVVMIDVKPGKFPNRIELENNVCSDDDNLRVAVLTTPAFDALTVDVSTVELGDPSLGGTVTPIRSRERDVDLDGDSDLLLVFPLCDLVTSMALDLSSTELVLTGMTLDSVSFTGTDSVIVHEDDD